MKLKDVDFEMKSIGWNMGQYGHEREQRACGIEILELKIDDVDILKELDKLEDVKTWEDTWGHHVNNNARLELKKILEAEG